MVGSSVMRRPSTACVLTFSRSSICAICGPPPWTTIGRMPTCRSRAMSAAKLSVKAGSTMA